MIINSMTEQYSKVSVSLNKSISSKVKKEHGIYFTPAQLDKSNQSLKSLYTK